MKKVLSLLLLLAMLGASALTMTGCSAPKVEEIYDRVVYLVEGSHAINTVFYGVGMPVYRADSEYANINYIYFEFPQSKNYELVTEHSRFANSDEVMAAAREVYSEGFLNDVLALSAFTGYVGDTGAGQTIVVRARYWEQANKLYHSTDPDNVLYTAMRVYDYSTMEVHALARANACTVTMESWLEDSPDKVETVEIYLIKQDGQWFLDSFTGA